MDAYMCAGLLLDRFRQRAARAKAEEFLGLYCKAYNDLCTISYIDRTFRWGTTGTIAEELWGCYCKTQNDLSTVVDIH